MSKKTVYLNSLNELSEISARYNSDSDTKAFSDRISEINSFMVTTPIIGEFSAGKSSMINSMLGCKLLSTNIRPETAVPTEIYYGNNRVTEYRQGNTSVYSVEEFDKKVLAADDIDLVQIEYDNEILKNVRGVKLVDMPGFNSGIERHNNALDKYLPTSLAYILAVPANAPTLRESVVNFLNELKIHEVPVYLVITKADQATYNDLEQAAESLKKELELYLGIDNAQITSVCSQKNGNVDGFVKFLEDIHSKSDMLFDTYFKKKITADAAPLAAYLERRLKAVDMSEEEIDIKIEEFNRSIEKLESDVADRKADFARQAARAVDRINSNVRSSLEASSESLANMLKQGLDINNKINYIIRNSVTSGIKAELEPAIVAFADGIEQSINVNAVVVLDNSSDEDKENEKELRDKLSTSGMAIGGVLGSTLTESIASVLSTSAIGTAAGAAGLGSTLGALAGPLGIAIGAAIGLGITSLFAKRKNEERTDNARSKVNAVIEQAITEAGNIVEGEIKVRVNTVSEQISEEIREQKEQILASLEDAKREKKQKADEAAAITNQLNNDLEAVRRIINEL
ncbi:MAG: dynamin family protein [Oscillospiraceae bacterium]|nr:dynamin family protein [Oscillospiraceae bacterium]